LAANHNARNQLTAVVLSYGLGILSVTAALLITQSLQPTVFPTPLFFAAIVISTWFGGTGPGLVAVVLATTLLNVYFISPTHGLAVHARDLPYLAQFILPALLSGWFTKKRKEAETALKGARDQLDVKVRERTAQLQQINEQLQSEIAERQRAEEAVHKTQSDLAHLTRVMTMSELATSIAHEVNQPLAAIVTNGSACTRWLAAEPPNLERARESIIRIIKEGNRASEIIKRIRGLSKKTSPHQSLLSLNEVIQEVLGLVGSELMKSRIQLATELDSGIQPVLGDRVQLQQVMLNLIVNAIEAMEGVPQRARALVIRTGQGDVDYVQVSIRDTGVGLDSRQLEHIFEAFFTTKAEGVGMGLSISRSIIESHGGRLWAVANQGSGATFQFTLPIAEKES
jgi:C4-dicarboxylate-specific signal transduction histidine kinase